MKMREPVSGIREREYTFKHVDVEKISDRWRGTALCVEMNGTEGE